MDSTTFARLQTSLRTIKTLLAQDAVLGKLLVADNPTNAATPQVEQVRNHIFIQPVIDVETTPPFDKPCFITLTIPEGDRSSATAMSYIYRISVFAERKKWVYGADKLRVLEMVERIVAVLSNAVTAIAQPLAFNSVVETVINKYVYGYSVLFNGIDGIGVPNDNK